MSTPDTAASLTPLVDGHITDPMRVPTGFTEWARHVEVTARKVRQELRDLQPVLEERQLAAVPEALAEFDAILDETSRGLLRRVVSRPPWQLTAESPARGSLDRRLDSAVRFARETIATSEGVRGLFARLSDARRQFEEKYPSIVSTSIEKGRLRVEDILNIRRAVEVTAAERRLTRFVEELERREAALHECGMSPDLWTVGADEAATPQELASACALALVERSQRQKRQLNAGIPYSALLKHLESIDVPAKREAPKKSAAQGYLFEDLLTRACRIQRHVELRGADAPLWCAALGTAADESRLYRVQGTALRTAIGDVASRDEDEHSYFLVPLNDDLVLVSQAWKSAIRLWSARLAIGLDVDGQVIADRVSDSDASGAADIQSLFTGTREATAWYKPFARVRVHVVAHFSGGWVARLKRRGVLHRGGSEPWSDASPEGNEFRIVVRPTPPAAEPPFEADAIAEADGPAACNAFAGFTTIEVRTSLGGDQLAWRRNPSTRGHMAARAIAEEWRLLHLMSRGSQRKARGIAPLSWTTGKTGRTRFPLYRMPLAVQAGTPQFESLARPKLDWCLFTIREIAKCVRRVHELGFALGTVHPSQFVYMAEPNGRALLAVPRPVLAYAPAATRLGEQHVGDTRLDHAEFFYDRLRTPLLAPTVASRAAATVDDDIYSFGVCALELLAVRQLTPGIVFYSDLRELVRKDASVFLEPRLAVRIADALVAGNEDDWLRRLIGALDGQLGLKPEDWLGVS